MNKQNYQIWVAGAVFLCCYANPVLSQPQVTSDETLPTNITSLDNRNFTIHGGNRAGDNLFHSFSEFSVPAGGEAAFDNALDVQNIISRVTGGSISKIDGLIRANGSANLFLLNPNGIIFGRDAKLDIGGSFIVSTANRLDFADGNFFSATNSQAQPLLTVSVPVGLQFGKTAGLIVNQSNVEDSNGFPVGLQIQPGKTLAMVGSGVFLEDGKLTASGGRIELGSVASPSLVRLTPISEGWALGYEGVQNFQDLQIFQEARVDTRGERSGDIQLRGRRIAITDSSEVVTFNDGANLGGTLGVKASESLEVSNSSELSTGAFSTGKAADIAIETKRLIVGKDSFIDTSSSGDGRGGNLTINASEFVQVNGGGVLSRLSTQAFRGGDAGELQMQTRKLILRDGGQISSSTRDLGNGGNVLVNASDSVEVSGQGEDAIGGVVKSGLFSETTRPTISTLTTGNGGNLQINTGRLVVQNGASISVAATQGSTGQAGTLGINALESVEVSGVGSSLLAASESSKPAGNLTIDTINLLVRGAAEINVSSLGTGNAGNLDIRANSIQLEDGGKLTATSKLGSGGGNINLQNLELLTVSNGSEISTTAKGEGNGGNINIDTDNLVLAERSNITASAVEGRGGNISITTQGLFVSPDSIIDASSDRGIDGVLQIRRPDVDPSAELAILPADVVDVSGLVAQGCSAGSVASGESSFAITGRGGLPPTPAEATRSESILADLGIAEKSKVISQKSKGIPTPDSRLRGSDAEDTSPGARFPTPERQFARAGKPPLFAGSSRLPTPPESSNKVNPAPLVEATGWVIGSNGEVVLTASATNDTLNIPWIRPNSCNGT